MASWDFTLNSALASWEPISGASIVASNCPSFTSEPTSTYNFFTKLLTFAYKSTCWKAISSPGTYSVVESRPFCKDTTGVTAALSFWPPPALSFFPPAGFDLLPLSDWLSLFFPSPSEDEQPLSTPSAGSTDAKSTMDERLFFIVFIIFFIIFLRLIIGVLVLVIFPVTGLVLIQR